MVPPAPVQVSMGMESESHREGGNKERREAMISHSKHDSVHGQKGYTMVVRHYEHPCAITFLIRIFGVLPFMTINPGIFKLHQDRKSYRGILYIYIYIYI